MPRFTGRRAYFMGSDRLQTFGYTIDRSLQLGSKVTPRHAAVFIRATSEVPRVCLLSYSSLLPRNPISGLSTDSSTQCCVGPLLITVTMPNHRALRTMAGSPPKTRRASYNETTANIRCPGATRGWRATCRTALAGQHYRFLGSGNASYGYIGVLQRY